MTHQTTDPGSSENTSRINVPKLHLSISDSNYRKTKRKKKSWAKPEEKMLSLIHI